MNVKVCHQNKILLNLLLLLFLPFLSFYNLALSFSLGEMQACFVLCEIALVIASFNIFINVIEKNILYAKSSCLFGLICTLLTLYLIFDNNFLINIFTSSVQEKSFYNLLALFIGFIINLTYTLFTLLFCISLIIFIPHGILAYITTSDYRNEKSFLFLKEICIFFILSVLLKSIINMFLQRILM